METNTDLPDLPDLINKFISIIYIEGKDTNICEKLNFKQSVETFYYKLRNNFKNHSYFCNYIWWFHCAAVINPLSIAWNDYVKFFKEDTKVLYEHSLNEGKDDSVFTTHTTYLCSEVQNFIQMER